MLKFVHVGPQISGGDWNKQFAWFDTNTQRFEEFLGKEVFSTWEEFTDHLFGRDDSEYQKLAPPWLFENDPQTSFTSYESLGEIALLLMASKRYNIEQLAERLGRSVENIQTNIKAFLISLDLPRAYGLKRGGEYWTGYYWGEGEDRYLINEEDIKSIHDECGGEIVSYILLEEK